MQLDVLDAVGFDDHAEITFVATPVGKVVEAAQAALAASSGVVTDVGSVKADIAATITNPPLRSWPPNGGQRAGRSQRRSSGAIPERHMGHDANRVDE